HAPERGILSHELHPLPDTGADVVLLAEQQAPNRQVGPQPAEGQTAEASTLGGVEVAGVLALAAASQHRVTGSMVTMGAARVLGQSRLGGERAGIEAGRSGVTALVPAAQLGQPDLLGGVPGFLLTAQYPWQFGVEFNQPLGLADQGSRIEAPVRLTQA